MILAGLGVAAVGFAGRYLMRQMPTLSKNLNEAMKFSAEGMVSSKYYKGGFDQKMNRREAALILGNFYPAVVIGF